MEAWQPIDTAPRTGYIWLGMPFHMRIGFWAEGKEYENHGTVGGGWIDAAPGEGTGPRGLRFAPTHWQRLPLAPTNGDQ